MQTILERNLTIQSYVLFTYLLLSHFSCIRLCVTPEMAAHQPPPSLELSRQEHWSGLPFPSPMHEVKSENEVAQSSLILSDPKDCSLTGSSVHGSGVPLTYPINHETNQIKILLISSSVQLV